MDGKKLTVDGIEVEIVETARAESADWIVCGCRMGDDSYVDPECECGFDEALAEPGKDETDGR